MTTQQRSTDKSSTRLAAVCSLLLLASANVMGQTDGVVEIHSNSTLPGVVLSQQTFRVTYVGYNLRWGVDESEAFDQAEFLDLAVDEEDGIITLDYDGPGPCFSPGLPVPVDTSPHSLTFDFPGVPAGDYTVQVNVSVTCGDGQTQYEHALRVYESPDVERVVFLEQPRAGVTTSGIGLVRGWACYDSQRSGRIGQMSYQINDGPIIPMAYGDSRTDTENVCGPNNTATGFGAAEFWGKYGQGDHDITLYVDGEAVETRAFSIAAPEEGFLPGRATQLQVGNFPSPGSSVRIEWSQPDQNFIITEF